MEDKKHSQMPTIKVAGDDMTLAPFRDRICIQVPYIEISGDDLTISTFEADPIEGHEPGDKFPNCCPFHISAITNAQNWFDEFPTCCKNHEEVMSKRDLKKSDYEGLPLKILNNLSYTEHHISKRIDTPEWHEDITNYIDYIWWSFGHPNIGLHKYSEYLIHYLKNTKSKIPKYKKELLIEYIEDYGKPRKKASDLDLNDVYETFQKWVKTFPFDLPYFKGLKEQFERKIPAFKEPLKYNPYWGMAKPKTVSQVELIAFLDALTKLLISEVKTHDFQISDLKQHRLKIENESLRVGTDELVIGYSKGELKYVIMIKRWLNLQRRYFKGVSKIVGNSTVTNPETLVIYPAFAGIFVTDEAAHRALRAAMSAGIIDVEAKKKLGVRKMISAIVQFWEAASDRKHELTHVRAEKERVSETYEQQCKAIAEQFGAKISQSAIYANAGKRAGGYFTAVARALERT